MNGIQEHRSHQSIAPIKNAGVLIGIRKGNMQKLKEDKAIEKRFITAIADIKPSPETKRRIWENIKQKLKEDTK